MRSVASGGNVRLARTLGMTSNTIMGLGHSRLMTCVPSEMTCHMCLCDNKRTPCLTA